MPRESTPGAQKLDSVAHFFCCKRADQAQEAPHLLADGIALLCRQDNPSVALSGSHQCGMNPAEIASIKAVEHSIFSNSHYGDFARNLPQIRPPAAP